MPVSCSGGRVQNDVSSAHVPGEEALLFPGMRSISRLAVALTQWLPYYFSSHSQERQDEG